jgi:hypothetical protein
MQDGANFMVLGDIQSNIPLHSWLPITETVRSAITVPVVEVVDDAVFGAVGRTRHDTDHRGLNEFLNRAGG